MEIIIRNSRSKKKIDIEPSIVSIDSIYYLDIANNIVNDYNAIYVKENLFFINDTVKNELDVFNLIDEGMISKIFKIFDIDDEFLSRDIKSLSYSEKVILNIIRSLKDSKYIIFDSVINKLDYIYRKKFIKFFDFLKNNDYYVFLINDEIDFYYQNADYSLVWNSKKYIFDNTYDLYNDVGELIKNKMNVPTLPYITYQAKEKYNVKLFYSKDVRDIIKDIYKHVKH